MKEWICEEVPAVTMDNECVSTFMHQIQELIRCKDCKRKQRIEGTENIIYCPHVRMRVPVDWFCADGERKEQYDTEVDEKYLGDL